MASLVVNGIDIEAVKEQLLLLGHSVDDRTIVDFVAGLDLGGAETSGPPTGPQQQHQQQAGSSVRAGTDAPSPQVPSHLRQQRFTSTAHAAKQPGIGWTPAAANAEQQQRMSASAAGADASPPRLTLDQRCRLLLQKQQLASSPSPLKPPEAALVITSHTQGAAAAAQQASPGVSGADSPSTGVPYLAAAAKLAADAGRMAEVSTLDIRSPDQQRPPAATSTAGVGAAMAPSMPPSAARGLPAAAACGSSSSGNRKASAWLARLQRQQQQQATDSSSDSGEAEEEGGAGDAAAAAAAEAGWACSHEPVADSRSGGSSSGVGGRARKEDDPGLQLRGMNAGSGSGAGQSRAAGPYSSSAAAILARLAAAEDGPSGSSGDGGRAGGRGPALQRALTGVASDTNSEGQLSDSGRDLDEGGSDVWDQGVDTEEQEQWMQEQLQQQGGSRRLRTEVDQGQEEQEEREEGVDALDTPPLSLSAAWERLKQLQMQEQQLRQQLGAQHQGGASAAAAATTAAVQGAGAKEGSASAAAEVVTIHVPTRARQAAAAGRLRGAHKAPGKAQGVVARGCGSSADGGSEGETDQGSRQQQRRRRGDHFDQRRRQQQQEEGGADSEYEDDVYAGVGGSDEDSDLDIPEAMLPPHLLRKGGLGWPPAPGEGQPASGSPSGAAGGKSSSGGAGAGAHGLQQGEGWASGAADSSMSSLLLRLQQATSRPQPAAASAPSAAAVDVNSHSSPLAAHRAGLPPLGVPGAPSREASAGLGSPGGCVGALGPLGSPWSSGVLLGVEGSAGESIIAHIGQEGSYGRRWHPQSPGRAADPMYRAPRSPGATHLLQGHTTPRGTPGGSTMPLSPSAAAYSGGKGGRGGLMAAGLGRPGLSASWEGLGTDTRGLGLFGQLYEDPVLAAAGSRGLAGGSGGRGVPAAAAAGIRRGMLGGNSMRATMAAAALGRGPPSLRREASSSSSGGGGGGGSTAGGPAASGPGKKEGDWRRASSSSSMASVYTVGYAGRARGLAPGVAKVDRVARYQQLKEAWGKDRFLRGGAGGATPLALPRSSAAGGASCAPAGNRRPRSNFAGQFAAAHAAEQLAAVRMSKEARSTSLQQQGRGVGGEGGPGSSNGKRRGA